MKIFCTVFDASGSMTAEIVQLLTTPEYERRAQQISLDFAAGKLSEPEALSALAENYNAYRRLGPYRWRGREL